MPKKKNKCIEENCDILTHGLRCLKHNYSNRKIHKDRKEYSAAWARNKKYGITQSEFDLLWIVFKGRCGICNCKLRLPLHQRGQPLDVVALDHNHITGNIRGLLCNACNKGLGLFKDSVELLNKAKDYLS